MGSVSGKSPEEYRGEQIVRATCSLATLLNTVLFIDIASLVLLHANDSLFFFFLLAQPYWGVVIEVSFVKHSNVGYVLASARAYYMVSFVKKSQMNQILFRERGDKFFNKKNYTGNTLF